MSTHLRSILGGRVRIVLAVSALNIFAAELVTAIMATGLLPKTDRLGEDWRWAAALGLAAGIVAGLLPSDSPTTTPFASAFKTQLPTALLLSGFITPRPDLPLALAVMIPIGVLMAAGLAFMISRVRQRSARGAA